MKSPCRGLDRELGRTACRELRRRTRVVGAFPDGNSDLLLVSARLRHIAGKTWGPSATWT